MGFGIEFVGGPCDGEERYLKEDLRAIKITSALWQKPSWRTDETGPPEAIATIEVTYLRTKRFSASGNRIYQHVK